MAQDLLGIYNLALSSIGTRVSVSDPAEDSREAELCNLWFPHLRDFIFRAAPWPSAKAHARLSLLKERDSSEDWVSTDPDPGFRYAYAVPSDMVNPRYLSTWERFVLSTFDDNVSGRKAAIMSNVEKPILVYTLRQTNLALWDAQLYFAVAHALSATLAMPLHGKANRAKKAEEQANELVLSARSAAANTDVDRYDAAAAWHTARGYAASAPVSQFVFPDGPLFSLENLPSVS